MCDQSRDSVPGHISRVNTDVENSSDFSSTIYSSDQQSIDYNLPRILCDTCLRDGKHTEAASFCGNCEEYLCEDCNNFHKKLPVLRNHVLQNKENMPRSTKVKVKDTCEDKCSIHSDRVTEYICQSCDQLGCTICMTTKHNQCSKVDHIPDVTDGLEKAEEYRDLRGALKGIAAKLEQNKAKYESNLQKKTYMKVKAIAAIRTQRENINKMYEMFEKEMESELTTMDEYNESLLKLVHNRQESLTNDLVSMTSDLEHKEITGQKCKLFIAMKKAKDEISTLQDEVMKLEINNHLVNYKFQPSDNIGDLKERIKHSGKILLHFSLKKEEIQRKELSIKSDDDKVSCTVSGLCLLPEDKLVIADVRNEAVKVIDIKGEEILSKLAMTSKPWGITSLDNSRVAVTLPEEKKIMFLLIDESSSLTADKDIDVDGACRGIAHSRGQLILSFDKPESKIQIRDCSGKVNSTFTRDSSGNLLFIKPWYLALSEDRDIIYVSDNSRNTVTSLTLEGKVMAIYEDKDLKKPVGLAVDDAGTVFVIGSSMYSSNIHQLTENFSQVQVFQDFSHGIICPRSGVYDSKEQKLYVGMEFSEKLLVISMKSDST